MKTAQDIVDSAKFQLVNHILTLMRKLDAYFWFGNKKMITGPKERIVILFAQCTSRPCIRIKIDNSCLDVENTCFKECSAYSITNKGEGKVFVTVENDGATPKDIDSDELSIDELLAVATVLEETYKV